MFWLLLRWSFSEKTYNKCDRLDIFEIWIFVIGNDFEGCPPKCASSKFGCCDDNVTEATGPDQEGCLLEEITSTMEPEEEVTTTEITTLVTEEFTTIETETSPSEDCKNTTYRCCPDGVTTAQGPGEFWIERYSIGLL